jgi:hypothetical protein
MKDITFKISWNVIADCNDTSTVAVFVEGGLCDIVTGNKSEMISKLERLGSS